jgi:hypothetical protein
MVEKEKVMHRLYIIWNIIWQWGIVVGLFFWSILGIHQSLLSSGRADDSYTWFVSGTISALFSAIAMLSFSSLIGWLFHGDIAHFFTVREK